MSNENKSELIDCVEEPSCCLCLLRGGALKQTDDLKNWAHITCSLCISGVVFKSPSTRSLIHIPSHLFTKEKKLNHSCCFCEKFTKYQTIKPTGLTVKCELNNCETRFHITCGQLYGGCVFAHADWPGCMSIVCHEHAETFRAQINSRKVIKSLY